MTDTQLYRFDAQPSILQLLKDTAFARPDVAALISDLCSELLFLREEGREPSPTFLFSASESDTCATFREGGVHRISLCPPVLLTARVLVKQLALLSAGCWLPCIEVASDTLRPLLVISKPEPYNTPVNRAHHNAIGQSILFIEKLRPGAIRLRLYPRGGTLHLVANPIYEIEQESAGPFEHFLTSLSARAFPAPFWERLKFELRTAVFESHGVLFVVGEYSSLADSLKAFKSYVRLEPPIDLAAGEFVTGALHEVTEAGTAKLGAILSALARTDGIIVFGSDATVHAYSAFVDIKDSLNAAAGGARTLARNALMEQHADRFLSMLFRSQDGQPQFIPLGGRRIVDGVPRVEAGRVG